MTELRSWVNCLFVNSLFCGDWPEARSSQVHSLVTILTGLGNRISLCILQFPGLPSQNVIPIKSQQRHQFRLGKMLLHPFAWSFSSQLRLVALLALGVGGATLSAAEPTASLPVAPFVAPASDEPLQSMDAIRLPAGWHRELFAAEPDVANIVAFDIDNQGRVYVCETFRQNKGVTDNRGHDDQWLLADLSAKTVQDRIDYHKRLLGEAAVTYAQQDDRIRRLRDTDGDGKADESVIFADGFNRLEEGTGAGVLARGKDVYYTCIPKLWKLMDADDDGKADERVVLSDGYGVRVAYRGHDMHGLIIGPDGRLYFSIGDRGHYITQPDGKVLSEPASGSVFRCELDGSKLEVIAGGMRNPQELAFNDYGDLFTGDNNSDSGDKARLVQVVPGADAGWRMYYQYLTDRGPFNREKIWHPYHDEQPAYIVPPIANFGDGPSGLAFDPGTGVDPSVRGKFFLCDFGGGTSNSGVRSFQLEADGAFYKLAESDQPIWNVMATDVAFGPDGALWVSDWVSGWDGVGKGRLYRITGADFDAKIAGEVANLLRSDFTTLGEQELISYLSHADRRVRNESTWELAKRAKAQPLAAVAADTTASTFARLHAVWGIGQVVRNASNPAEAFAQVSDLTKSLLTDKDNFVRAAAAQFAGQQGDQATSLWLRPLLNANSSRVRLHSALALADLAKRKIQYPELFSDGVKLLADNDNKDPVLRHAGVMLLAAIGNVDATAALKSHASVSVRRAAVVTLRRLSSERVSEFLGDESPLVTVEAARAIHDAPIPAALDQLAKQIQSLTVTDDAFLRRVLNANFRLGTQEHADALGAFAARPAAPLAMRLEAIEMLKVWATPDPRDRVLGDHRAIAPRDASVAVAALRKSLSSILQNSDEVRDAAVSVAAIYGMPEVTPFLEQRVADRNLHPETRAESLRSLARLQPESAVIVAASLLESTQVKLRVAAFETIASIAPADAIAPLSKAVASESVIERQAAWDSLARINLPAAHEIIISGLKSYLAGTLAADTALNVIDAAGPWLDESMTKSLSDHQAALEASNPLGRWWASLEGGDGVAGAVVFNKTQLSCVRCHRIDRNGGEVGPALTLVGKERDRRYLLESICLPDAAIAKGFDTAVLVDDVGQVFTGIIRSETDDVVELIAADGSISRIDQDSIVGRKRGKSAMSEELTKYTTPRELRDLVAYLASLQIDPRGSDAKE